MRNFWDFYAIVYDSLPKHFNPYQRLLKEINEKVADCCVKGKLLDAGCGTGNFTISLAKMGYDVVSIDSSSAMLRRLESKKKKGNINTIKIIQSNLEQHINFPDSSFDVVICIHSLYIMKEPENLVKEYLRILRPKGYLILCEPQRKLKIFPIIINEAKKRGGWRKASTIIFSMFLLGFFNFVISLKQGRGDYHYWDQNEIKKILTETGFKIISINNTYADDLDILSCSQNPL